MSAASRLVDILEQQSLLEAKVLAELRKQLAAKKGKVKAEAIAKLLISKGHLTKFQASKLLEQVAESGDVGEAAAAAATSSADDELGLAPSADEELGLAPTAEDKPAAKKPAQEAKSSAKPSKPAPVDDEIVEMEEAVEMEVIEEEPTAAFDSGGSQSLDDGGMVPLDDGGLAPLDDGGLEPLDGGGLQPLDGGLAPLDGGFGGMDPSGLAPIDANTQYAAGGVTTAQASASPEAVAAAEELRKKLAQREKNVWDSKWLLIGSSILLLILLTGVALYFSLTRGNEAEFFKAAEDDYRAQSYTAAIKKYEQYLEKFPKGNDTSKARVRIAVCKLRVAVEQSNDAEAALKTAQQVLPTIETEEAIAEGRGDLAALLPQISENLLKRADKIESTDEKARLVALVDETTALIENPIYLSKSLRDSQKSRFNRIREDRARIDREINRSRALAQALQEIDAAVAAQDTTAAYAARTALLKRYPELESGDAVRGATQKITDVQRDLVVVKTETLTPTADEIAERAEFLVVLAAQRGNGNAGLSGRLVYVLAEGAVYALRANDGKVAWRRYVGDERIIQPQPVSAEGGADALIADSRRQELVRIAADSGKPVWRLAIGEPFQTPQIAGKQIFVTTDSGRMLSVDVDSGQSNYQCQLPQRAAAWSTFDARRPYLYQLGEHSNIYALAKDSLRCAEVFYLGHLPGTIAVPPVLSLGHLFVAENAGPDYSVLHIIATDANGLKLSRPQEPIRLQGHVRVPPFLAGRRVVVVTDTGALYVFDVETTTPQKPVTEVLKEIPKSFDKYLTYPYVDSTNLWLAGRNLSFYEMLFSKGQLKTNWIDYANDTFVATPQRFDETIVIARRPANSTGLTVSAIHGTEKTVQWETDLSVPAGQICVDAESRKINSISSRGALFEINGQTLKDGFATPTADVGSVKPLALTQGVDLGGGRWALVDPNDPGRVAVYDATRSTRPLRLVTADVGSGKSTAAAIPFAGGVVIPLDNGQVAHVDLTDGNHAHPFQPTLQPNTKFVWRRPALIGDGSEFVIADNRLKLYRIGMSNQNQRHLQQLADADMSAELISPLAAVGSTLYGAIRGGSGDILISYQLPNLKAGKDRNLDGRVIWGPETVGDMVLLISDSEGLICLDTEENQKWAKPMQHDAIVGSPVLDDGSLLFASVSGEVWRVDPATGDELGAKSLGEPLASGPVPYGTRVLLSGRDGVLHIISKPAATAPSSVTAN